MPAILQSNPKFARNVDSRLIRVTHPCFERCLVPMDKIGRLMPVQSDAVAGAVRQARELVAGPPSLALVIFTDRIINAAHRDTQLRSLEGDLLSPLDGIPHLGLPAVGLAMD